MHEWYFFQSKKVGLQLILTLSIISEWYGSYENGPYQLLKENPTIKIKIKKLKRLKNLQDNEFTDNKLY